MKSVAAPAMLISDFGSELAGVVGILFRETLERRVAKLSSPQKLRYASGPGSGVVKDATGQ